MVFLSSAAQLKKMNILTADLLHVCIVDIKCCHIPCPVVNDLRSKLRSNLAVDFVGLIIDKCQTEPTSHSELGGELLGLAETWLILFAKGTSQKQPGSFTSSSLLEDPI